MKLWKKKKKLVIKERNSKRRQSKNIILKYFRDKLNSIQNRILNKNIVSSKFYTLFLEIILINIIYNFNFAF